MALELTGLDGWVAVVDVDPAVWRKVIDINLNGGSCRPCQLVRQARARPS